MKKKRVSGKKRRAKRLNPKSRFSGERLTSRVGLIPMSLFMDKLGIEGMVDKTVSIVRGRNGDYGLGTINKAITLGVISGGRHLSGVVRLAMDEVLIKTRAGKVFRC